MKSGFSLVELLIIIAIISIISTIGFPNFIRLREIYIVKGEMQRVISFVSLAKSVSLKYNEQVCVTFPKGTGTKLKMFIDSNRDKLHSEGEKLEQTLSLNESFQITSDDKTVCFPPTGIVLGSNETILFAYGNQSRKLIVSAYGRVRIEK